MLRFRASNPAHPYFRGVESPLDQGKLSSFSTAGPLLRARMLPPLRFPAAPGGIDPICPLSLPFLTSSSASTLGCDIHTHAPSPQSSTNFLMYPFVLRTCSANSLLGMGMGMSITAQTWKASKIRPRPGTECPKLVRTADCRVGECGGRGPKTGSLGYAYYARLLVPACVCPMAC